MIHDIRKSRAEDQVVPVAQYKRKRRLEYGCQAVLIVCIRQVTIESPVLQFEVQSRIRRTGVRKFFGQFVDIGPDLGQSRECDCDGEQSANVFL